MSHLKCEVAFLLEERMPRKPRHPCAYPGCPELTEDRYCERHAKETARNYEMYKRDPKTKRRYGRAWKRIRDRYISLHPFCEECMREGISTLATEVHHRLPLSDGGTNEESNLEAVCKSCHSRIHMESKRPKGR